MAVLTAALMVAQSAVLKAVPLAARMADSSANNLAEMTVALMGLLMVAK